MPQVVIYTDFDGTITGRAGERTVFGSFYQSLLANYIVGFINNNYKTAPMKDTSKIQELFIEKFGIYDENFDYQKPDADLLMSKEAVASFHQLLKNDQVKINIVTKNRSDYIRHLFKFQGFTDLEINRITVMESGDKYNDVYLDLGFMSVKPTQIYIMDDNRSDLKAMFNGALEYLKKEHIHQYVEMVGQFKWKQYLTDIEDYLVEKKIEARSDTKNEEQSSKSKQMDDLPNSPESNVSPRIKIISILGGIGFAIGFGIGAALAATGIFAPLGVSILGIMVMGLIFAGGLSAATVGFSMIGFANLSTQKPQELSIKTSDEHDNTAMAALGKGNSTQDTLEPAPHFGSVFSGSTSSHSGEDATPDFAKKYQ